MAQAKIKQLQDRYLERLKREKIPVTAYLMNGVPIKGKITAFDSFVVLFEVDGKDHLVFKHAISTIQPSKPVNLSYDREEEEAGEN